MMHRLKFIALSGSSLVYDGACRGHCRAYGASGANSHAFGSERRKNGCVIINDSYNSDLASLDIALDFMSRRSEDKGKKRTLILSDMLETGQSSKLLYRQVAELVHSRGVEKIIGVGDEIRTASSRFELEKYFFIAQKTC